MKKLLLSGAVLALSSGLNAQVINTFPYVEDFENEGQSGTGCTSLHTMVSPGWNNVAEAGINRDWLADVGGTGSNPTGPTANGGADYNPGVNTGHYLYLETSSPCSGETYSAELETPWFDFTAITSASMSFWYHMFGTDIGTMEVQARQGINGAWTSIGPAAWTDNVDIWQEREILLDIYAGVDSVQFKIIGNNFGAGFLGDMAIDNFSIFENLADDVIAASISSAGGCGLTNMEPVSITITNNGFNDILAGTTIPVGYTINGGTAVNENMTVTNTLTFGASETYTFIATADLSVAGTYNFVGWASMMGDLDNNNDTVTGISVSIPLISTFPYMENFENGPSGWIIDNSANGSWSFGTPAHGTINSASSGDSAFVTGNGATTPGNYNANEDSWVESPCFDITSANGAEHVAMKVWWEAENSWDGANLNVSTDGGLTWMPVGSFGTTQGDNWYNDNTINGAPGGSQEGWTGRNSSNNGSETWLCATHKLDSAMMVDNASLKFRVNFGSDGSVQDEGFAFDDFAIGYPFAYDALPDTIIVCDTVNSYILDAGAGYEYYHWAHNNSHNQTDTITANGTYTVTVSDSTGMCARDQVYIEFRNFVRPNLMDMTICAGDSAMFVAPFDTNYTYTWSNGAMSDTTFSSMVGTLTLVQTDTSNGCVVEDSAMLMNFPGISGLMDVAFCDGDTQSLDAGAGYNSYIWSNGDTTQMTIVSIAGTYTVTVLDTNGCTSMDSLVATVNPLPTPDITGAIDTICWTQTITLDGGAGFSSYMWSTGGSAQMEAITGSNLGIGSNTITVVVTDGNSCSNSDSVMVYVDQCTSIDELEALNIAVYPNPTNGLIRFNIQNGNNSAIVSIVSINGKLVYQTTVNANSGDIDITELSKGIYMMTVESNGAISTVKLVKE